MSTVSELGVLNVLIAIVWISSLVLWLPDKVSYKKKAEEYRLEYQASMMRLQDPQYRRFLRGIYASEKYISKKVFLEITKGVL